MDRVFQGNSKGIGHRSIVDGNSTAIIHHPSPVLDVKNAQLHIVHLDCICTHIRYSKIGRRKRLLLWSSVHSCRAPKMDVHTVWSTSTNLLFPQALHSQALCQQTCSERLKLNLGNPFANISAVLRTVPTVYFLRVRIGRCRYIDLYRLYMIYHGTLPS